MRRKPVLSHSPLLFPTIPAIVASVLVPAFFVQAQAQTLFGATFEEDKAVRQQNNIARKSDKDAPTTIWSERYWGRPERFIHFENNVQIVRDPMTVTADKADYSFLEDEVRAIGRV